MTDFLVPPAGIRPLVEKINLSSKPVVCLFLRRTIDIQLDRFADN
jgi:hypothetical protein